MKIKSPHPQSRRPFVPTALLSCGLAVLSTGSVLRATTDISTLSPAANTTISPSAGTDTAWTVSTNSTVGGIAFIRTAGGQSFTFTGSTGSEVLTFSNTSTPVFATNSFFNGTTYWGNMVVAGSQGINLQTGFNNLVLQTGLSWTATGTMTFTQPASDGNIIYAQGNNVLASNMDLNLGSGSKGSLLVINGNTTQTAGALTGTANDYVTAYSGSTGVFRNSVTPTGTNTTATSGAPVVLQIGNTNSNATFAGVIGAQSGSNLAGTDTSAAAGYINLVKLGTGTQTFTGANVYSGSTTISAGTLTLSSAGSIANSTVYNIAAGATLDVSAKSAYGLASVATTLGVGATTNGFINGATTTALTLGNSLTLNFTAIPTGTSFNLYDASGVSGDFSSVSVTGILGTGSLTLGSGIWSGTFGGYDLSLTESSGTLTATASAIPEPSTYAALLGVTVFGFIMMRRRNAVRA
ncbi:MAG: autotransporter-associated beta strand repeat-containing protein [Verrucomicrobia bacterium]|nr:autotransporter-associated beta strand repeat-containing protein [Verrucomicrobiota bacterium]